ncbi:heat shock protein Pss1 [Orobanche minor]
MSLHTRPHPAIWSLVHGMAVIYLVTLTFQRNTTMHDKSQGSSIPILVW